MDAASFNFSLTEITLQELLQELLRQQELRRLS